MKILEVNRLGRTNKVLTMNRKNAIKYSNGVEIGVADAEIAT